MSIIAGIIAQDPVGMKQLHCVRSLGLPDWCIAAGFVRNRVWDHLHGISPPRPSPDIDVLFFDAGDISRQREADCEARLGEMVPGVVWEVRNQARMHLVRKNVAPHRDTAEAMTHWLETVTAVGVRLEADDTLTVIAPLGTDDLLGLRCRPTEAGRARRDQYDARIAAKRWRELWPRVRFLG